ncbi:hypothetical protein F5884DRAFT_392950 [Xylogone sp. PMI_703]|nr:hypothetical protein F5884DRAFT_392950 [Xylogone sp. PMI_703]
MASLAVHGSSGARLKHQAIVKKQSSIQDSTEVHRDLQTVKRVVRRGTINSTSARTRTEHGLEREGRQRGKQRVSGPSTGTAEYNQEIKTHHSVPYSIVQLLQQVSYIPRAMALVPSLASFSLHSTLFAHYQLPIRLEYLAMVPLAAQNKHQHPQSGYCVVSASQLPSAQRPRFLLTNTVLTVHRITYCCCGRDLLYTVRSRNTGLVLK